jgi:hypothetical protein
MLLKTWQLEVIFQQKIQQRVVLFFSSILVLHFGTCGEWQAAADEEALDGRLHSGAPLLRSSQ